MAAFPFAIHATDGKARTGVLSTPRGDIRTPAFMPVGTAGTVKALDVGAPALVAIAMGAVTGTVGGMIRDTLGHVPSVLLRHEIYVTASVLGACTYAGLDAVGVERLPAMIGGFLTTFTVRGLAIRFGWSLPVFRASETHERWRGKRKDPGQG